MSPALRIDLFALVLVAAAAPAHAASVAKAFNPTTIGSGAPTVLTFTVDNPAGQPARSDIGFTDTLPAGLVVAAPNGVGGTCANAAAATTATAGTATITVANLQALSGPSTCTVTVNVTNAAGQFNASCAGNPSAFTNASGNLAVAGTDANNVQPSCVTVLGPTVSKAFSPTTIAGGGTTVLTFTVDNPAGALAATNIGIVDTLPAGLVVAAPNGVGGTCVNAAAATTASAGTSTITVSNLQVPDGASICTVTVNVTNAAGQFNASCALSPAAFTNGPANVALTNVIDNVSPGCLVVTGGPAVASPAAPIPTLREVALLLLALGVGALGALARRRRTGS